MAASSWSRAGRARSGVFDDAGQHLISFGGEGEGPGEFRRAPDILIVPPDTLVALDRTALRYSWFTLDGTLVRDAPISRDVVTENFGGVFSREGVLLSSDGSFFHVGGFAPSNTEMRELGGIVAYRPIPNEIAQSDIRWVWSMTEANERLYSAGTRVTREATPRVRPGHDQR